MASASVIDELLSLWQQRRAAGEGPSVDELCRDRPELHEELSKRIEAIERLEKVMAGESTAPPAKPLPATVNFAPRPNWLSDSTELPRIPGYDVLGRLGEGGMGTVYKATQLRLKRTVALKVLSPHLCSAGDVARIRAEAEAVAKLNHPHIVQIYESGEWQPPDSRSRSPYLVLEYVPGGSLDRKLTGGPLPPLEAARLLAVLARAVHAAHRAGLVHRDLKPHNILLADPVEGSSGNTAVGFPKIADFGLVKSLHGDVTRTAEGVILGTPAYMAPEQTMGRPEAVGAAADIYSLGIILYECLVGRVPFRGDTPLASALKQQTERPEFPAESRSRIPQELQDICLKCLEKDPASRYPSAAALADALAVATAFPARPPVPAVDSTPRANKSKLWLRALLVVAVLLPACLLLPWQNFKRDAAPTEAPYLEHLTLYIRRQGRDDLTWRQDLVRQGADLDPEPWQPPLRPEDDLKLLGRFGRPTFWYLLWFDTNGKMTVAEHCPTPQVEVLYPAKNEVIGVDRADPLGVHLLLLAAGDVPPSEGVALLEERMQGVGKPPALPQRWSVGVRGPSQREGQPLVVPPEYLRAIEERMPPGLETVHAVFLPAER